MDTKRVKEIMSASDNIQVLYQGSPVWIENITDNNTAQVKYLETQDRVEVPVYKLVEVSPVKH